MPPDHVDIEALLPLPEATTHILIALKAEPLHGYAIIQDIAARPVRLSPRSPTSYLTRLPHIGRFSCRTCATPRAR